MDDWPNDPQGDQVNDHDYNYSWVPNKQVGWKKCEQGNIRAVGSSENLGVPVVIRWA